MVRIDIWLLTAVWGTPPRKQPSDPKTVGMIAPWIIGVQIGRLWSSSLRYRFLSTVNHPADTSESADRRAGRFLNNARRIIGSSDHGRCGSTFTVC
jgi:hypothetical protein